VASISPSRVRAPQLRTIRLGLNLTQDRLAALLDVSRVTISQYERDGRVPRVVQLAVETLQRRARGAAL
jgi:transcriptional regulator with XRE-family HTH domain